MAPPPTSSLAKALAPSKGSGPAGLSAALLLCLTTQVPRREVIAVVARAPESTDTIRFVSRAAATGRMSAVLSPIEVALLEVLRDWDVVVESPADEAKRRIAGLIGSGDIRPDRVAKASLSEPTSVRERLRALLSDVGKPELAASIPAARNRRPALAG
jgi:hypothetical protein